MRRSLVLMSGILFLVGGLSAFPSVKQVKNEVAPWIMLGPLAVPETEMQVMETDEELARFHHLDPRGMNPVVGETVSWGDAPDPAWKSYAGGNLAVTRASMYYMATWIDAKRWISARFLLERVDYAFVIYLDGKALTPCKVHASSWKVDLKLTRGKHKLIVKMLVRPKRIPRFLPFLEWGEDFGTVPFRISLDPRRNMGIEHVLNATRVTGLKLSPNGRFAALSLQRLDPASDKNLSWVEVLDTRSGERLWNSSGVGSVRAVNWMPDSREFAFIRKVKDKGRILAYHMTRHSVRALTGDIERLDTFWCSPKNKYLVYSVAAEDPPPSLWHHVRELPERSPYSPNLQRLYIHYLKGGVTRPLTRFDERFHSAVISPDGTRILLERDVQDVTRRPYHRYEAVMLDSITFERTPLLSDPWVNSVQWAPDSRRLLVLGGPSAFKGRGNVLPAPAIPNDYDTQAYIMDINSRIVKPITRGFDPSISDAHWNHRDGRIYFQVLGGAKVSLVSWKEGRGFQGIGFPVSVIHRIAFSDGSSVALAWASGTTVPHRLYRVDLNRSRVHLLRDYNADLFRAVQLGRTEDWDFRTTDGRVVPGRLYYPADFNPNLRYPVIVYYYGGTSPVSRDFAGRYPKNWYAAQGYMVYVLQPTGTVGYGQKKAAVHVNDWGEQTSAEVIAAVTHLARSHPNVDGKHMGAMGASYGGFLTQYLAASTRKFAAFISHAGISSLSSYWGVGDWGYLYSGVASADAFPWNRKPMYVGKSPLFLADRIQTPLLLLHGEKDNNVPPGESYQMYAALKLLGREAALVTFRDQQHFILDPPQRRRWMRTIIAWFDRWLKDQPQAWRDMYPEEKNLPFR